MRQRKLPGRHVREELVSLVNDLDCDRIAVASGYPRQPQSERHCPVVLNRAERAQGQQVQRHVLQGPPLDVAEQEPSRVRLQADVARVLWR